jgi:DNA mismatch repair protein MutL
LKFLKRASTELGHIEETVQHLALSHPEVQFSLTLNERQVLKTSGTGELRRTMEEVFNLKRENIRLLPITAADPEAGFALAGFASEPGVMRTSKRWMLTYVNNRTVRCSVLLKAIEAAYESLLPHDKYPLCVLFVNLPPTEVDVNVHPTKKEVRYAAANSIFGFVRSGIRESLSAQGISFEPPPVPEVSFPMPGPDTGYSQPPVFSGYSHAPLFRPGAPMPAYRASGPSDYPPGVPHERSVQAALNFYQPGLDQFPAPGDRATEFATPPAGAMDATEAPERFKVIGQLFNTYILLETIQGLMVVDQHIASERTFFEALTLNLRAAEPAIQHLVTAQPLAVSPLQRELLMRDQAEFAKLGFLYTLEDGAVQLTGYPLIYTGRDRMFESGGLFENLLAQLEETGEMKPDLDHLIATLSCHSAVRAGDTLTIPEMHSVVAQWLTCQLPWTCPHGRPIAHTISKSELNQFFHRPSLPVNAV